ncbi:MAG TPA: hypothetical protein VGY77_01470 [Gemmataceae bacterium]|jgi:hypothetical protein|nr:hypothetical protein [Gemmataceae bacterium]
MTKCFGLGVGTIILLLITGPQAFPDTKSGDAKLQEIGKFQDVSKKALKVSLGDKVKANCSYYINPDFFGKKVISVQANIKNTSNKLMYYGYFVAFFDKDKNMIACSSFSGDIAKLDAGKETNIGNVIQLPADQINKIVSYQVTLLEDEKEFGK